jgi:hypothetical protein
MATKIDKSNAARPFISSTPSSSAGGSAKTHYRQAGGVVLEESRADVDGTGILPV